MWPKTSITQLLNIVLPIVQAPMAGGITTPAMVAAVSNAGGLGSYAAGYNTPEEIRQAIHDIRQLTNKPFAVNLFIPEEHPVTPAQLELARKAVSESCKELNFKISPVHPPYAPSFSEQIQVVIDEKVSVFSFTFGLLDEKWKQALKANQTILIGTATNLAEARLLEEQGVDIIAAQGSEAGGHRGTFVGKPKDSLFNTAALTKTLIYHIKTPILAAGGIMDAEGVISMLGAGATGVQMGTAFIACSESGAHPAFKKFLLKSEFDETILTNVFSGKLARGIKNTFMTRMQVHEQDILHYPMQNALTTPMRRAAAQQNNIQFMSMWAGQHAYLSTGMSAGEFIQAINKKINLLFGK